MIRVLLPYHLQQLAGTGREVELEIEGAVTPGAIVDAVEQRYPMLRGTICDPITRQRRAFIRFFACGRDFSHDPLDTVLPETIAIGRERFMIVGAMAGG